VSIEHRVYAPVTVPALSREVVKAIDNAARDHLGDCKNLDRFTLRVRLAARGYLLEIERGKPLRKNADSRGATTSKSLWPGDSKKFAKVASSARRLRKDLYTLTRGEAGLLGNGPPLQTQELLRTLDAYIEHADELEQLTTWKARPDHRISRQGLRVRFGRSVSSAYTEATGKNPSPHRGLQFHKLWEKIIKAVDPGAPTKNAQELKAIVAPPSQNECAVIDDGDILLAAASKITPPL